MYDLILRFRSRVTDSARHVVTKCYQPSIRNIVPEHLLQGRFLRKPLIKLTANCLFRAGRLGLAREELNATVEPTAALEVYNNPHKDDLDNLQELMSPKIKRLHDSGTSNYAGSVRQSSDTEDIDQTRLIKEEALVALSADAATRLFLHKGSWAKMVALACSVGSKQVVVSVLTRDKYFREAQ
ncbi:hypothetical protein K504DRAFT_463683 [Pleomassaria siparia CBS 279.74]|uniref:Uncharacterized protein n=1 Tax=Pleomassaria siparia CBS 279.74 TaxID=1314801 RepID=A0A6G1JS32_9PLEO|nr:hypothetical protein K504DRAFT_463683 [Pleomassaria siparia CBS 279.74]